ncbi:MAG: PLP-dependent cysteine synthase family protein [Alphaproteobacteria bacterium]|nr:PLP-dependent cysteine synthase family protein [Alphaproteobacteria bacterium]
MHNNWLNVAIEKIEADFNRSADTHLLKLTFPGLPGIDIYLKDESTHPTGSLKHRLARSLFLYALCNGKITKDTTVVEASSGSTAVSEAYFANMIGVPFIAVIPKETARKKISDIEFHGGQCHFVDTGNEMRPAAISLASSIGGVFLDQFTYAERATDWRGNNNIAESIFNQMSKEHHPVPSFIVVGAGTGGTSATIGRYIKYKGFSSSLVVADPENSAFYEGFQTGRNDIILSETSRIEGIGRPQVEASFIPSVIDQMIKVPDGASIASIHWLEHIVGKKVGGSTGTNLWASLLLAQKMAQQGKQGSIVTLICDSGERYLDTYFDLSWVADNIGPLDQYLSELSKINSVLAPQMKR